MVGVADLETGILIAVIVILAADLLAVCLSRRRK
jgi:hypothetical protein